MTRRRSFLLVLVALLGLMLGCNKPSTENCRKALQNMQVLMGTEHLLEVHSIQGEVRRCRGGSTREAVDCAIKATSLDELRACGFATIPAQPVGGTPGSTGSAAAGSADGSAATGSADGSAATGSADGSAAN